MQRGTNVPSIVSGRSLLHAEICARWRSSHRPRKALLHTFPPSFLFYLSLVSELTHGGGQTEPGPGLPGNPGLVP